MTTTMSWLPRVLRWVFGAFTILFGIGLVGILIVLAVDPKLPAGTQLGPMNVELLGLPGSIFLDNAAVGAQLVHGGIAVRVNDAAGLIELLKHVGLPVALLQILFFMGLFDLLRRLFRNVARGESFTRPNLRLVQIIGFSLVGFSLISCVTEGWFMSSLMDYLAHHSAMTVSGTAVRLPHEPGFQINVGGLSPSDSPLFFSGLLVLALSEVFRQGLALKSDNDLTI